MRLLYFLLVALFFGCNDSKGDSKMRMPSSLYQYVQVDTVALPVKHAVYAPVYSHIYGEDGRRLQYMSATLSVRNVSFRDSFFVTGVVYYDSQGKILRRYLDSTLLVAPMHSVEFVVERSESEGGAGANFVVNWAASRTLSNPPLIQTVMNEGTVGLSLVVPGVSINP